MRCDAGVQKCLTFLKPLVGYSDGCPVVRPNCYQDLKVTGNWVLFDIALDSFKAYRYIDSYCYTKTLQLMSGMWHTSI